jgi:hypothetical protein
MNESRSNWLAPLLVAAMLSIAVLVVYPAAYLALGRAVCGPPGGPPTARFYRSQWQATLFTPAAAAESALRGRTVAVEYSPSG